jgi:hypothetical protein
LIDIFYGAWVTVITRCKRIDKSATIVAVRIVERITYGHIAADIYGHFEVAKSISVVVCVVCSGGYELYEDTIGPRAVLK